MASRLVPRVSALFGALAVLLQCSVDTGSDGSRVIGCEDGRCSVPDGSAGDVIVHDAPYLENDAPGDASAVHVLCGINPTCIPDDVSACADYTPPANAGDAGTGDGAAEDASPPAEEAGSDAAPRRYACMLGPDGEEPAPSCQPAGPGQISAPCSNSRECAPGLACVGDAYAGQCRPYCCRGFDTCGTGSFCTERPLRESVSLGRDTLVPVCAAADRCDLVQPYPCSEELRTQGKCTCKDPATACTVVRGDGTTACVEPGSGQVDEACPCAWGHICSRASEKCLKLCELAAGAQDCGGGRCQAAADLPAEFGVCVGDIRNTRQ